MGARTWTPCASGGSCGEFVPAIPVTSASGMAGSGIDSPIDLIGLEESTRNRSNVGLINPSDEPALVRLTAYTAGGSAVGSSVWTVGGRELKQISLRSLLAAPLTNVRVRAEIISHNQTRLIVYGSVIDKVTGDPAYIGASQ